MAAQIGRLADTEQFDFKGLAGLSGIAREGSDL
jgi:hypothetical protein